MTKNRWGVEFDIGEDDLTTWEWGEDYGEAYASFVKEVSIEAVRVFIAELAKDLIVELRTTENNATVHGFCFDGYLDFSVPLDTLVADFLETFGHDEAGKIDDPEERAEAERMIGQLEQAAVRIRALLG